MTAFLMGKNMDAGFLNTRITIEHKHSTVDAVGAQSYEWRPLIKLWANVRHVSGSESIKADALAGVVRASVRIRFRQGLDTGMQVVLSDGSRYGIEAILPDMTNREFVDLVCEKVQ